MIAQPDLRLKAPAKINLWLRLLHKRIDDYHNLQTLFQFLDFSDELEFTFLEEPIIKVSSNNPHLNALRLEENLVFKAAKLMQDYAKIKKGVQIYIDKQIPMGGGLGGGSSDCATTMIALNHLWKLDLSLGELQEIGRDLGADVPIFIYGRAAWGEGIGDRLTPANPAVAWALILVPDCAVPSARIFKEIKLTNPQNPFKLGDLFLVQGDNDLEPIVRRLYPEVDSALNWLSDYAPAHLSGSGSCVFAQFGTEKEARQVLQALPEEKVGFLAKCVNISPLVTSSQENGIKFSDWGVAKW